MKKKERKKKENTKWKERERKKTIQKERKERDCDIVTMSKCRKWSQVLKILSFFRRGSSKLYNCPLPKSIAVALVRCCTTANRWNAWTKDVIFLPPSGSFINDVTFINLLTCMLKRSKVRGTVKPNLTSTFE